MYREPFLILIFLVLDTIFLRKSLELTKNYHQKLIAPNGLNVYIYVKEQIDWQWEKRPKGKELVWTKDDADKYGNLTVTRIRVIGKE